MKRVLAFWVVAFATLILQAKDYRVLSPNGEVTILIQNGERLLWSVSLGNEVLIAPSEIALTLSEGSVYGPKAQFRKAERKRVDQVLPS
ncbi:MAG: hypothetical protein J6X25_06880, partial [Bacteroidales bacterium]|nr:hypothetical protein [Bacteroidales bacterium]